MAWFRARAGALEQQGAARVPKNATLPCLSAKKEHKDFFCLLKSSTALPRPYLCLCFVLCLRDKTHLAVVWASTHRRASSSGSPSFSLVLHTLEEWRKCRRYETHANHFWNSHHTRMFTLLAFFFFFLQSHTVSPCRTATPHRYLRHLHSYSRWETWISCMRGL